VEAVAIGAASMRTVRVLVAVRPSVSVATQSMVSVAIWLVSMTMPLRIRRVLPQCGHRRGGLTVCGTRWACAREVAIRGAKGDWLRCFSESA